MYVIITSKYYDSLFIKDELVLAPLPDILQLTMQSIGRSKFTFRDGKKVRKFNSTGRIKDTSIQESFEDVI